MKSDAIVVIMLLLLVCSALFNFRLVHNEKMDHPRDIHEVIVLCFCDTCKCFTSCLDIEMRRSTSPSKILEKRRQFVIIRALITCALYSYILNYLSVLYDIFMWRICYLS